MVPRKKSSDDGNDPLQVALDDVHGRFGSSALIRLGDEPNRSIETISTGILTLDTALGIGGLPRGRIIEIFGAESSGKSTLSQHLIAEAQRRGGTCALIDPECALSPEYMRAIGVDYDNLLYSNPDFGEMALEIVQSLTASGALDMIVIDSVAALTPRAEIEGEMGDAVVGMMARLMSQALRKLTGLASKTDTMLVFINQLRESIGKWAPAGQTATFTPGGRALKFYSSVRMEISGKQKRSGTEVIGTESRARIVKNKAGGIPFKVAEFDIIFGKGIDRPKAAIDAAIEIGLISQRGAWFDYEGLSHNGGAKLADWFDEEPDRITGLMKQVSQVLLTGEKPAPNLPAETVD